MSIGIYKITNKKNGDSYIGRSVNIEKRFQQHISNSFYKNGSAYNYPLQKAIREFGLDNFDFIIQEECEQEQLKEKELIHYHNNNHNYNQMIPDNYDELYMSNSREVIQINSDMEIVEIYESINSAAKSNNLNQPTINECCKGKRRSTGGFFWCYLEDYNDNWAPMNLKKSIYKIDIKNLSIINTYQSPQEIIDKYNIDKNHLSYCLNGKLYAVNNFIWVYTEDYDNWAHDNKLKEIYNILLYIYENNADYIYEPRYYSLIEKNYDYIKSNIANISLIKDTLENDKIDPEQLIFGINGNGFIVEKLKYKDIESKAKKSSINKCLTGKRNAFNGLFWIKDYELDDFILPNGVIKSKSILRIDTYNLKIIEEYESIMEAKNKLGLTETRAEITDCAKGVTGTRTAVGFYWRYKKDYDKYGFQSYELLNSIYKKNEKIYEEKINKILKKVGDNVIIVLNSDTLDYVKSFKNREDCASFYNISRSRLSNLIRNRFDKHLNLYFILKSTLPIRLKKYYIEKGNNEI